MSRREEIRALLADEERAKLVREASEEVNKFISSLPKKKYEDGWPEDKWEEEAEKHPMFMSKFDENQELPPLVEAFQSLKYDPEFNDPTEVAKAHKEDGNEQFKKKKYDFAVAAYSEGLKLKSEDNELNATLYSNRAAAFYHMGNYKKSLEDAIAAKNLVAGHVKATHRGALCYFELRKYEDCISWCEDGLKLNEGDTTLTNLKKKAIDRMKYEEEKKISEEATLSTLTQAIKERGIKIKGGSLSPQTSACDYAGTSARLEIIDNQLIWPVVLLYPQYGISDFIPNFNENSSFYDYFCELFKEHPEWDTKQQYVPDDLKVYFCDEKEILYTVDMKNSLKSVLQHESFKVVSETLEFYVTCPEYDEIYRSQNYVIVT